MHKDSAFVDVCPQNVYHQHQETAQYETLWCLLKCLEGRGGKADDTLQNPSRNFPVVSDSVVVDCTEFWSVFYSKYISQT